MNRSIHKTRACTIGTLDQKFRTVIRNALLANQGARPFFVIRQLSPT